MKIEITQKVLLNQIRPNPYQSRLYFDQTKIEELARNIQNEGLIYPVTLVKAQHNYTLVDGERRFRAFEWLQQNVGQGFMSIPALVKDVPNDKVEQFLITNSLIANEQRENISTLEKAFFYAKLVGEDKQFATNRALSQAIGKNEFDVSKLLKIAKATFSPELIVKCQQTGKGNIKIFEQLAKITDLNRQKKIYFAYCEGVLSLKDLMAAEKYKTKKIVSKSKILRIPSFVPKKYNAQYKKMTPEQKEALGLRIESVFEEFFKS